MSAAIGQARECTAASGAAGVLPDSPSPRGPPSIIARRMIAFGCSIIIPDVYRRCAEPGIRRAAEADSVVLAHAATSSIARSYNLLLDRAGATDDLEGLVIVHQDAEMLGDDVCATLRGALADPEVAVVGCVGVRGVRDIAWWDGDVTWNSAAYHYGELGGGELTFAAPGPSGAGATGEVDSVYGVLIGLSPWAVRNIRFDESIGLLHGYDFDVCRQARAAGRKVVTADLRVAHHHALDLVSHIEIWIAAHMRAAERWEESDGRGPTSQAGWKARARAAEASAGAARLLAASRLLQADASAQRDERELDTIRNSASWRITEPLRRGNAIARAARRRLARG
jgi:Glycosyltransferase like family